MTAESLLIEIQKITSILDELTGDNFDSNLSALNMEERGSIFDSWNDFKRIESRIESGLKGRK